MTNAEMYKKVFGFEPDYGACPTRECKNCPIHDCFYGALGTKDFWDSEYKEKADIGEGESTVIDDVSCQYCKYDNKAATDNPCSICKNNNMFEWKETSKPNCVTCDHFGKGCNKCEKTRTNDRGYRLMPSVDQILKVLKDERDCKRNAHDYCWENCESDCPYFVSYNEKMEVLDFLIGGYELMQKQGAEEYCIRCDTTKLSQEELDRLMGSIKQVQMRAVSIEADIEPLSPDDMRKIMGMEGTD